MDRKINDKKYYQKHKEKILERTKKYYQNNKNEKLSKQKLYNQTHKEEKKEYDDSYYKNNKNEKLSKQKLYNQTHKEEKKKLRILNREKTRNYERDRLRRDINFKLTKRLRIRLYCALKGNFKSGSAVKDLGCSIPELKTHLESKFQEGMSWENWSRTGWHIDHIRPLDSFDLTNREEFLKACHYTNLQPLWAEENLIKHNNEI